MSTAFFPILRVKKSSDAKHATAASDHNYRKYPVANADEQAPYPSPEYLNLAERGYWELAKERIQEAGVTVRRKDAVQCVEVMLSASPEWFKRDEKGQAADYSNSKWTKDNLAFLQKTFGEKNVLAFKLHQDEKTPHIHALVVPLTSDNRLSARDVFGRPALRHLQTNYANAMAEYGLRRGVEKSQAKHKPMKQFYGQQAQTAQQAGELLAPVESKLFTIDKPAFWSRVSVEKWVEEQSRKVNDHFQPLLAAANQRAEVAAGLALENAAAKDQVRILQKQLHTSESHKQSALNKAGSLNDKVTALQQELAGANHQLALAKQENERLAVAALERRSYTLIAHGKTMEFARDVERFGTLHPLVEETLKRGQFDSVPACFQQVTGYAYDEEKNGQPARLRQLAHPHFSFTLAEARADGQPPLLLAVNQVIEDRAKRREQSERLLAQMEQERVARQRQERAAEELALMQRAFTVYNWQLEGKLQACLLVPTQDVRKVNELLKTPGSGCYGHNLTVSGEPLRRDGLTPVYVCYNAERYSADFVSAVVKQVTQSGGEFFESASHQASREQALRQVSPPARQQEREPFNRGRTAGLEM